MPSSPVALLWNQGNMHLKMVGLSRSGSQRLTQIAGATWVACQGADLIHQMLKLESLEVEKNMRLLKAWFKDTVMLMIMVRSLPTCKLSHTYIPVNIDHLSDVAKVIFTWSFKYLNT